MAIIILVIVAIMSAMILGFSSQTIKTTSNIYLREQARLLGLSATEYALLALSGHDHYKQNNGCLKTVNIDATTDGLCYEVNMSISYILNGINNGGNTWCNDGFRVLDNNLRYNESNLTVIIDTIVTCTEDDSIRFHRRSIQKP